MNKLYLILPLALILCFLVGCKEKEAVAELEAMKAQAAVEEQNKELIRQYYAEFDSGNRGEIDKFIDKFISPNCVIHFPGGIDISGVNAIIEYYVGANKAFPDTVHTIDDVIAEGDKIAFRATTKGTHQGEFMGIQPTGNAITVTFDGILHIQDGKIVEWWSEYDALGLMQQLGMELKPKEGEK